MPRNRLNVQRAGPASAPHTWTSQKAHHFSGGSCFRLVILSDFTVFFFSNVIVCGSAVFSSLMSCLLPSENSTVPEFQ